MPDWGYGSPRPHPPTRASTRPWPGRLGYRWSRSPTIRRAAAPSATNRRNRPWGPARLQDHGVLSGGVLHRRRDDVVGHHSGVQLGAGRTPATHLRDAVQHSPDSPGRPWCRGEIDAHQNGARSVIAVRKPVQRLGASRVAHRLPLNTCRTRHLDGTPTGAEPSSTRCPASPRVVPKPWVASAAVGPARTESLRPTSSTGRSASECEPVMSRPWLGPR